MDIRRIFKGKCEKRYKQIRTEIRIPEKNSIKRNVRQEKSYRRNRSTLMYITKSKQHKNTIHTKINEK